MQPDAGRSREFDHWTSCSDLLSRSASLAVIALLIASRDADSWDRSSCRSLSCRSWTGCLGLAEIVAYSFIPVSPSPSDDLRQFVFRT